MITKLCTHFLCLYLILSKHSLQLLVFFHLLRNFYQNHGSKKICWDFFKGRKKTHWKRCHLDLKPLSAGHFSMLGFELEKISRNSKSDTDS